MQFALAGIAFLLALISAVALINMAAGPFLAKRRESTGKLPWITVCVPARNEEENIGGLLDALHAQDWDAFDILVLDDGSGDSTSTIVQEAAELNGSITLLQGEPLPEGWTGKNWACHQLSLHARGEVLLFVDADVRPGSGALRRTAEHLQHYRADMLSAFPRQLLHGVTSKLVVPVMDLLLYGFLPLQLVYRTRFSSLAAANGQWIAFTRVGYERVGGHAAVRSEIVEDIRLAQRSKMMGLRMLLTSGVGIVECRMYTSGSEVLEGFSKNYFAAFGFRTGVFAMAQAVLLGVFVFPYIALALWPSLLSGLAVVLNILLRSVLAFRLKHGALTVLLHPVGIAAATGIGIHAVWQRYRYGSVRWKGRSIPVQGSGA